MTRCESKDDMQRNKLLKELREDRDFKEVADYFKRGIFFTGSINPDDYLSGQSSIVEQYKTVLEYRNDLINEFKKAIEPFQISQSYISELRQIREILTHDKVKLEREIAGMTKKEQIREKQEELQRKADAAREMAAKKAHDQGLCSIC